MLLNKDENGRKTPQPFSTFIFEYENENGKAGHENECELTDIENLKNEPIQAKLCRTQLVYENLIWNTDPQCITINKCYGGKFQVQESRLINLVSFTR
jgi:hypothetical protein